jgi:hypothetical protein
MTDDEMVFYDALGMNDTAAQVLGNEKEQTGEDL